MLSLQYLIIKLVLLKQDEQLVSLFVPFPVFEAFRLHILKSKKKKGSWDIFLKHLTLHWVIKIATVAYDIQIYTTLVIKTYDKN